MSRIGIVLIVTLFVPFGIWWRGCPSPLPPIHLNPNMDSQPRYDAQTASEFFYDGAASQLPVAGTVARGELEEDEVFFTGGSFFSGDAGKVPFELAAHDLERGKERFEIHCTPCHGTHGDGQSRLREHAGIESADLFDERIVSLRAGRLFKVITKGEGLMKGYSYLPARDRWLIVAHVQELQRQKAHEARQGKANG